MSAFVIADLIADLTDLSQNFPWLSEPLISRDNSIHALDYIFSSSDMVIIEGPEEVGKTTLIAQFARVHANHTFSHFIRPVGGLAFDLTNIAADLIDQIEWHLDAKRSNQEEGEVEKLRHLISRLNKRAKLDKVTYYFCIDGLTSLPEEKAYTVNEILSLLPIANAGFKFLIAAKWITWTTVL